MLPAEKLFRMKASENCPGGQGTDKGSPQGSLSEESIDQKPSSINQTSRPKGPRLRFSSPPVKRSGSTGWNRVMFVQHGPLAADLAKTHGQPNSEFGSLAVCLFSSTANKTSCEPHIFTRSDT
jgi:hypothetical protein